MENNRKIRVGITHGDINGIGYEVILKTFAEPLMFELCTPIVYGSPKVAAYHRKAFELPTNFSIVNSASEAQEGRMSIVNCSDDEVKVEFAKADAESGKAAFAALEKAIEEYKEGLIDVIVTAPINKHTIQSEDFSFPGHTEYIEQKLGDESQKALMILMKGDFRVALVTGHIPVKDIATTITKDLITEKITIFHESLKQDFGISAPRIAVLSLNPHAGDSGLLGKEEEEIIVSGKSINVYYEKDLSQKKEFGSVCIDYEDCAYNITKQMIDRGNKNIMFINTLQQVSILLIFIFSQNFLYVKKWATSAEVSHLSECFRIQTKR